jgi:hypothetical protein
MTERYNSCLYDWLSEIGIAVKCTPCRDCCVGENPTL